MANPRPALIPLLALLLFLFPYAVYAQTPSAVPAHPPVQGGGQITGQGVIEGQVQNLPPGTSLQGGQVTARQFSMDAQGQLALDWSGGATIGPDGRYRITAVPIKAKTVYLLEGDVAGIEVKSRPSAFGPGQTSITMNLEAPSQTTSMESLQFIELLNAADPSGGAVWITEVMHLMNLGQSTVTVEDNPLVLHIPEGAGDVQLLGEGAGNVRQQREGDKLLLRTSVPPGRTSIALRYRLPVWLGRFSMSKPLAHPFRTISVIAPQDQLSFSGAGFTARDPIKMTDGPSYAAWIAKDFEAGDTVHYTFSGIPIKQEAYLLSLAVFVVLMTGVLVVFFRRRMGQAG